MNETDRINRHWILNAQLTTKIGVLLCFFFFFRANVNEYKEEERERKTKKKKKLLVVVVVVVMVVVVDYINNLRFYSYPKTSSKIPRPPSLSVPS